MSTLNETFRTLQSAYRNDEDLNAALPDEHDPLGVVEMVDALTRNENYEQAGRLVEQYDEPERLCEEGLYPIQKRNYKNALKNESLTFLRTFRHFTPTMLKQAISTGAIEGVKLVGERLDRSEQKEGLRQFIVKAKSSLFEDGLWRASEHDEPIFDAFRQAIDQLDPDDEWLRESLVERFGGRTHRLEQFGFLPWALNEYGLDIRSFEKNYLTIAFREHDQDLFELVNDHNEALPDDDAIFTASEAMSEMSDEFEQLLKRGQTFGTLSVCAILFEQRRFDHFVRAARQTQTDETWERDSNTDQSLLDEVSVRAILNSDRASEIVAILDQYTDDSIALRTTVTFEPGDELLKQRPDVLKKLIEHGFIGNPLQLVEASMGTDGAPGYDFYESALTDESRLGQAAMKGLYRLVERLLAERDVTTEDGQTILQACFELSEDERPSAEAYRAVLKLSLRHASLDEVYDERKRSLQETVPDGSDPEPSLLFTDDLDVLDTLVGSDLSNDKIGIDPAVELTDQLDELERTGDFADLINRGLPFPADRDARMRRAAELPDPAVIEAVARQDHLRSPAFNGALKSNDPNVLSAVLDHYDPSDTTFKKLLQSADETIVESDGAYTNLLYLRELGHDFEYIDVSYRINNMDNEADSWLSEYAQQAVSFVRDCSPEQARQYRQLLLRAAELDPDAIEQLGEHDLPDMLLRDVARALDRVDDTALRERFLANVTIRTEHSTPIGGLVEGWVEQARDAADVRLRRAIGERKAYTSSDLDAAIDRNSRSYFDHTLENITTQELKAEAVKGVLTSEFALDCLEPIELEPNVRQKALSQALSSGAPVRKVWTYFEQQDETITIDRFLASLLDTLAPQGDTALIDDVFEHINESLVIDNERLGEDFEDRFMDTILRHRTLTVKQVEELAARIEGRFEYNWHNYDRDDKPGPPRLVTDRPAYLRVLMRHDCLANPSHAVRLAEQETDAPDGVDLAAELPETARQDFVDTAFAKPSRPALLSALLSAGVDLSEKQDLLVEYLTEQNDHTVKDEVIDVLQEHNIAISDVLDDEHLTTVRKDGVFETVMKLVEEGVSGERLNTGVFDSLVEYPTVENFEHMQRLIESGMNVPAVKQKELKNIAANPNCTDILSELIEHGGELGSTVLYEAIKSHNNDRVFDMILNHYSPNRAVRARTFREMIDSEANIGAVRNAPYMAEHDGNPNYEKLETHPLVNLLCPDTDTTSRNEDPARTVRWLIDGGADPTARDFKPLQYAIKYHQHDSLDVILNRTELSTDELNNLLSHAIDADGTDALKRLLNAGAEPEKAFRRVAETDDHESLAYLLENGADPTSGQDELLLYALYYGQAELAEWLLESNEYNEHQQNPVFLYAAAMNPGPDMLGNNQVPDLVRALLDDGTAIEGSMQHPQFSGFESQLDEMGSPVALIQRQAVDGNDGDYELLQILLEKTGRPRPTFLSWLDRNVPSDENEAVREAMSDYLTERQRNFSRSRD